MRTYLNLIPPQHKKLLQREQTFFIVHNVVGIIVVVLAINAILLTIARFILVSHFNQIKQNTSLVSLNRSSLQYQVQRINNRVEDAAGIQVGFTKYTQLLEDITSALPQGITIDFSHISTDSNTFRITGTAQNRETLVSAKEILEALPIVVSLESPLSNFLEKDDIAFRFSGVLKPNIYKLPPTTSQ